MNIFLFCAAGILCTAVCVILRGINREAALWAGVASGVVLFSFILKALEPVLKTARELTEYAGMDPDIAAVLLKALGICYLTALCASVARDAGESAAAVKIELGGRVAVAAVSMPVFIGLARIITELVQGNIRF